MTEYEWICRKCRVTHKYDELDEFSKEGIIYYRCPKCHGENFTKTLAN